MLKLDLNGEDLLKLIEACGKSGVSTLKLGKDIELTFGEKANSSKVPELVEANATLEKEIELESFRKAEREIRKDNLESMLIENPVLYERLLSSGDLVDEETTQD